MSYSVVEINTSTPTSTGNQTYTSAGIGLVRGMLAFLDYASVNGTAADHASSGRGMCSATQSRAVSWRSEHNQGFSDTSSYGSNDSCILLLNPTDGAVLIKASLVSMQADSITVNYSAVDATARLLRIVLFAGDNAQCSVHTFVSSGSIGGIGFISPNFYAAGIYAISRFGSLANSSADGILISEGFATPNEEVCAFIGEDDNQDTAQSYAYLDSGRVCRKSSAAAAGVSLEVTAWNSSFITVTTRDVAESVTAAVFCFGAGYSTDAKAYIYDSPVATGNADDTNPGWEPRLSLRIQTVHTGAGAVITSGVAGVHGLSAATSAAQGNVSEARQDNVATTNTQSRANTTAIEVDFHSGTTALRATWVSWLSNGERLNWGTVDVSARKLPTIAFRKPFPAGSGAMLASGFGFAASGTVVRVGSSSVLASGLSVAAAGRIVRRGSAVLVGDDMALGSSGKIVRRGAAAMLGAGFGLSSNGSVGGANDGTATIFASGMGLSAVGRIGAGANKAGSRGGQVLGHTGEGYAMGHHGRGQALGHRGNGMVSTHEHAS